MKYVIVAGTPHSGKTAVLIHTIKELRKAGWKPSVVKIDCIWTDDDRRYEKACVPVRVGISGDMCPDHFSIYNTDEIIAWAREVKADIIFNETAGLCLRCAPYTDKSLSVCVLDMTSGPYTPKKIGPMLTTSDIVVLTKGDMISQAEREVFHEKVLEANSEAHIIEANGLSGRGSIELAERIISIGIDIDGTEQVLRHTPPIAVCTLCTGERRTSKKRHIGVLRQLNGMAKYEGE